MSAVPYSEAALAESAAAFAEKITPARERWQYCFERTSYKRTVQSTGEVKVYLNERTFPVVDRITGCYRGGAEYRLSEIKRRGIDGAIAWDETRPRVVTKPLFHVGPMQAWHVGHVYFARVISHPHVVKVGFSRRVRARLDDIENKAKAKIGMRPGEIRVGTLADEHWWHKNWGTHRIRGEWFFDPHMSERTLPDFLSNPLPTCDGAVKAPEAGSSPASGAVFKNPRCEHPGTCAKAHSKDTCIDCTLAWAERPKAEQVMLWQQDMEAAESEVA